MSPDIRAILACGMLLSMLAAQAQPAESVARIAFLSTTSSPDSPTTNAFRQGLRDLGYVEGQNIIIEWRWGGGSTKRFPEFAAEVVRLGVDVIVTANDTAGRAAQQATSSIPIVSIFGDPVGSGLVATLARPGGNITGVTTQSTDLVAKRLQLLKETVPKVSRVAVLVDTNGRSYRQEVKEAELAAGTLGVQVRLHEVSSPSEFNGAFATITRERAGAVFLIGGTMLYANRRALAERALKSRLPMMCGVRENVDAGCVISYGPGLTDLFRRAAYFVDKILKGAKPVHLPIEQPTKFELLINMRTAKALGLTIPESLLLRADQVVE